MFKALLKKQLKELTASFFWDGRTGRPRSKGAIAGYAGLFLLLAALAEGVFAAICLPLCGVLLPMGLDWLYFALAGLAGLALAVFQGAVMAHGVLYTPRDSDTLLALPIPPVQLLAARLVELALVEGGCLVLVLLPAYGVYGFFTADLPGALLGGGGLLLALGSGALAFSCLLGGAVAFAANRVGRYRSAVTVLCSLLVIGGYYLVCIQFSAWLNWLLVNAQAVAAAAGRVLPLVLLGRAGAGEPLALLYCLLAGGGMLAAAVWLLSGRYGRLLGAGSSTPRPVYREGRWRVHSPRRALLAREARQLAASPAYILNCALGSVLLLGLAVFALWRPDLLADFGARMAHRGPGMQALALCGLLCSVASANLLTAPSVSLEGRGLWQLQILPVDPWLPLRAKLELQMLLTALPLVLCVLCAGGPLGLGAGEMALAALTALLYGLLLAALGLALGVRMPNLCWTSETAALKHSMASRLTFCIGWALVLAGGAGYWLLWGGGNPLGYLAVLAGVLAALSGGLLLWLRTKGAKLFAAL